MAHNTYTSNPTLPNRRWSRPFPITLSDTNTERNLQYNGVVPYRYLHNAGTSGSVIVTYEPDNATSTGRKLYIPQGGVVEGGHWVHARSGSSTAGIELYGFLGMESAGS